MPGDETKIAAVSKELIEAEKSVSLRLAGIDTNIALLLQKQESMSDAQSDTAGKAIITSDIAKRNQTKLNAIIAVIALSTPAIIGLIFDRVT